MATITLTYPTITNGDPEDVDKLMSNLAAILAQGNGNLQVGANLKAASASPITGQSSSQGSSDSVCAADHSHVVQGFEALAGFPTSGNFKGRIVYNTLTDQSGLCINATGTGTWKVWGNALAADLPLHGSNHASGGSDPLPNGAVVAAMMGRTLDFDAILAADVNLTSGTYVDIWTGIAFTCHGSQSVHFTGQLRVNNGSGSNCNVGLKIWDTTAAAALLRKFPPKQVANGADGVIEINWRGTFADGAHTVKLQGLSTQASGQVLKQATNGGDGALDVSFLQVMVG